MPARHRGDYVLSVDVASVDRERVHRWLSVDSYWAKGRSLEVFEKSLTGSSPYSIHLGDEQVAFARVVSDQATFAWICDVYVAAPHRGKGLATWLVEMVVGDVTELGVQRMLLATRDAHEVYRRCRFEPLATPEAFMEIDRRPTRLASSRRSA